MFCSFLCSAYSPFSTSAPNSFKVKSPPPLHSPQSHPVRIFPPQSARETSLFGRCCVLSLIPLRFVELVLYILVVIHIFNNLLIILTIILAILKVAKVPYYLTDGSLLFLVR